MNCHGSEELLQIASHDLWARNRKILLSMGFEILGLVSELILKERGSIMD